MCNINLIVNLTELKKSDYVAFIQSVTALSYSSNGDAEGFYSTDFKKSTIKTSNEKIDFLKDLKESQKIILIHERLSTSGKSEINHQPIKKDGVLIAHNGVLSTYAKGGELSDTHLFLKNYLKKERSIKRLKDMLENVQGTYSLFLTEENIRSLFYVKDDFTQMHLYMNKEKTFLFATTRSDTEAFFNLLPLELEEYTIKPHIIYEILITDEIKFYERKQIKPAIKSYYMPTYTGWLGGYGGSYCCSVCNGYGIYRKEVDDWLCDSCHERVKETWGMDFKTEVLECKGCKELKNIEEVEYNTRTNSFLCANCLIKSQNKLIQMKGGLK